MKSRTVKKHHRGAVATGATAAGAASLGALAMGAMALGAIAVGAMAIGRLRIGRASLRRVEIGELAVGRLDVAAMGKSGTLTTVARIRSAPGKGNDLARLLTDHAAAKSPAAAFLQAHRSLDDPDLFLLQQAHPDDPGAEGPAPTPLLGDLLRQAAARGLVASSADHPMDVALFRMI